MGHKVPLDNEAEIIGSVCDARRIETVQHPEQLGHESDEKDGFQPRQVHVFNILKIIIDILLVFLHLKVGDENDGQPE